MEDLSEIDNQVERYARVSNALQEFEGWVCNEASVVREAV
jgi:hypothetical protein